MAEIAHPTLDTGLDATDCTLSPPDAVSAAHSLITSPRNPPPTLPFELVEDISELCWGDGEEGRMAVVRSCAVSQAFAATVRRLIWREVVIQCENVVKAYKRSPTLPPESRYLSASHWNISSSGRRKLRILARRPDLASLVQDFIAGRTAGLYQLLTFFQQSLRHLDLDDVPAPPNLHGDPLPDLNKFPSLETLQVTLRHCYTEVNEHILPANSLGQNFPRDGIDTSDDGGLAYMLDWLDTLPRPEQITLVFSLPPLAHPAMRKANKRVWRNCFQQLRVCSWWDAKVPKTVEKVDCSAIFDEDEE
ncbi:Proteophosphoglycan ppg4 [Rhodotorula toruloides]|nr:Proteophosphoglycan ppg4 [Rhodotorula toruloides]